MDACMNSSVDRSRNGFLAAAGALAVSPTCFGARAADDGAGWFAITVAPRFYQSAAFYGCCALVALAAAAACYRMAHRWRQRRKKQRDEDVIGLINEWTRCLQEEVARRKQAHSALKETQEFMLRQERLAAVGQLAAGLAHEFNNVMTIVQGHASLLMDNPNLDEESVKSLNHISDGVDRMAALIKQMLAFSRKQVMQQKALDVEETLGRTAGMLRRLLGEDRVLRFNIASNLPPILADPEMFQQIIVNLAVNARDAMSTGGQLTIGVAEAQFGPSDANPKTGRKAGRYVRLSVADTGSGMDRTTIDHLFEPFFTTKEVGKGSGLGLATVYGMVNQHQGFIEVDSKIGQGTSFDIFFPVTDQKLESPAVKPPPGQVRGGKETVLVVEDEEAVRELVCEILRVHGYDVVQAADGPDALRVWQSRKRIDLLLTDMTMPNGLSGRDLAAKLWESNPRLPVIFSSGYSQEMIERGGEARPGVVFLPKPYVPVQLTQAVRQALDAIQPGAPTVATPAG
jgi:signal transduction histidine kinase/ActR/RegA family two-component response regulator